jgi:hypothetical protein
VVQNLKDGMNTHLVGLWQSKITMAKDIVCTFPASQSISSGKRLAKMFCVDRRNIKKTLVLKVLLDTTKDAFWGNYRKAKWSDYLPEGLKKIIFEWWTNHFTVSPNRKDLVR